MTLFANGGGRVAKAHHHQHDRETAVSPKSGHNQKSLKEEEPDFGQKHSIPYSRRTQEEVRRQKATKAHLEVDDEHGSVIAITDNNNGHSVRGVAE